MLMRWPSAQRWRSVGLGLALAVPAALACQALRLPLPWTFGPLVATALAGVFELPVGASLRLRNAALSLIGVALGLYFTPAVTALLLPLAPAMALGVAWALLLGYCFYRFLQHRHREALPTPTSRRPSAGRRRWRCWPSGITRASTWRPPRIRCAC